VGDDDDDDNNNNSNNGDICTFIAAAEYANNSLISVFRSHEPLWYQSNLSYP